MRVVIISWRDLSHPLAGGSEVVNDRLARGLARRGHDVVLVCARPGGRRERQPGSRPEAGELPGTEGYRLYHAGGTYGHYLLSPLRVLREMADADLLVDVENGIPYFSPLWWHRARLCLIHHVHTDQWSMRFSWPTAAIGRMLETRVMPAIYRNDMFVAVSPSTASSLVGLGVPLGHVRVIPSGTDPSEDISAESPDPLFVVLGRLVPHKQIHIVLEAWKQVYPITHGRLLVVGDGPERPRLQSMGTEGVSFPGRVTDRERDAILAEAWLLLHAAHHEGWGMVIMEAAAHGTPTLALDAAGVRDAIVDGQTGILVPVPGKAGASHASSGVSVSSPDGREEKELARLLAEAWVKLARDKPARLLLGAAARQRAMSYTWDATVEAFLEVAEELVAGKKRRCAGRMSGMATDPTGMAEQGEDDRRSSKRAQGGSGRLKLSRTLRLARAFSLEQSDPATFYELLAKDTVMLVKQYRQVAGGSVLDVGGGPGDLAAAFSESGATAFFVEPCASEMRLRGRIPPGAIYGSGYHIPVASGTMDIVCSSNVLEHVARPQAFLAEMVRVARPGGLIFLGFTNWYSPHGGHETSPWHYLGGHYAARRYSRRHAHAPKNAFGESLFPLHVGTVLRWARALPGTILVDAFPRYLPSWARAIVSIPGLREVATWNLIVVWERTRDAPP